MSSAEVLANELERIVVSRIESGRLVVPPMPKVASTALAMTKDPNCSLRKVAELISRDPLLSASVLHTASSPAYGGHAVGSVEQALNHLGLRKAATVISESVTRPIFVSKNVRISKAFQGLWEHSVGVALLARDLAALSGELDGEEAYLAGLLHDIGKPVFAAMLLEAEKLLSRQRVQWFDVTDWIAIVQRSHRKVGAVLVERWDLPPSVQEVVKDSAEFDMLNRQSVANYVRFANAVVKKEGLYVGEYDAEQVDALVMMGRSFLGLDDDLVTQLSSNIVERAKAQSVVT